MKTFAPYPVQLKNERPSWWLVRLPEIAGQLKKAVLGKVQKICPDREVYSVIYNDHEYPAPQVRWAAAASSADPDKFKTSGYDPQTVMLIAGVHGAEAEGVVLILNLISLLETGVDLRGREEPELLELLKKYRLVMVPCCNPDGRSISPDHLQGVDPEEFRRISQGVWDNGATITWAESKEFFPLPVDRVQYPGGYPNRDGYNIMHDCAPGHLCTPEASAILELVEKVQPDLFLNLHSQENKPILGHPSSLDYRENLRRGDEIADACYLALKNAGYPALEPKGHSQSMNLNTAAVMLTGTLAMTFESTTDSGLSFDQILESHYLMLKTVLASGLKERFAPRNKR